MSGWLITGCSELVTLRGASPRRGRALRDLAVVRDGALLVHGGRIAAVGTRREIERLRESRHAEKLDLRGRAVLPGFVDSHTHLIFSASRIEDYEKRIAGKSYAQIARSGGGIQSTVARLRTASAGDLKARASRFLQTFAEHGTTTLEAKSGYGLDWPNELKILRLLKELNDEQPLTIVPTFLGAHVVPPEFRSRPNAFVDLLVNQWIPKVAAAGLAKFGDVFCDLGAFTVAQARRILEACEANALGARIHADQLTRTGASRLAIELNAASADHLDRITRGDTGALARSHVTCTLLPGCSFHLGTRPAPARALIDAGAIVALATDFNPGTSPTASMPTILSLACTQMRMMPAEAIAAATTNAAHSLGLSAEIGSLDIGKYADVVAFDVADAREIPYYFGMNLCSFTMKRGEIVYRSTSLRL
jgi:imidazolonepropionase